MAIQEFASADDMDDAFEAEMENLQEQERIKNITPTAQLRWSLDVECPKCEGEVDLSEGDDGTYSVPIFNNKWDDLEGEHAVCPHCDHEFRIKKVEY
jgi:ssDNA-binding Zn-finger/Zn-ribbon topoisomerase 1